MKILEPCTLTPKRTEYGKEIRKDYESGFIAESRHNMTQLEPREDGICNTVTTVQKDNYLLEPSGVYTEQSPDFQRKPLPGVSRTLKAVKHDSRVLEGVRIRKLTPLECFRLMGFSDEDFYKAKYYECGEAKALLEKYPKHFNKKQHRQFTQEQRIERISNSQLYKQAGNSIVVNVLEAILGQLF